MEAIRVIIGDIYPLMRQSLHALLANAGDIWVIGEAEDYASLLRLCAEHRPDVLVLNDLPPADAPEPTSGALDDLCPSAQVVMLAADADPARLRGLLASGAAGLLLKTEPAELIPEAIRAAAAGNNWLSPAAGVALATVAESEAGATELSALTPREREVLRLIVAGWSDAAIAAELGVAGQTARNYATRLYAKLGVHSRAEAMVWAREHSFQG